MMEVFLNRLLLIIDVQRNFINANTEDVLSNIQDLIDSKQFNFIAFTKYKNAVDGLFCRELNYLGCIKEKDQEIMLDTKNFPIFEKTVYTVFNDDFKKFLKDYKIDKIYLCGIDTDACVFKTALDLFENEYDVYVLEKYCRSHIGKIAHDQAITSMKRLIGEKRVIE